MTCAGEGLDCNHPRSNFIAYFLAILGVGHRIDLKIVGPEYDKKRTPGLGKKRAGIPMVIVVIKSVVILRGPV